MCFLAVYEILYSSVALGTHSTGYAHKAKK